MAVKKFEARCIYCGKVGSKTSTNSSGPSSAPAAMSGPCPSSPDKKHKPRWEEVV